MKALLTMQTLILFLLLVGEVLLTEAAVEKGSSANTTSQAQFGRQHMPTVSHTEWLVGDYRVVLIISSWTAQQLTTSKYFHTTGVREVGVGTGDSHVN